MKKGTSTTAEETWTVYLDKYAMVNLSKNRLCGKT